MMEDSTWHYALTDCDTPGRPEGMREMQAANREWLVKLADKDGVPIPSVIFTDMEVVRIPFEAAAGEGANLKLTLQFRDLALFEIKDRREARQALSQSLGVVGDLAWSEWEKRNS
jgi:hypothetical protein